MPSIRLSAITLLIFSVITIHSVVTVRSVFADAPEKKTEQIRLFDEATLTVPAEFKRTQVKSRIIEHEFQASVGVDAESKHARVTMMPAGGDVKANIDRWKGQFIGGADDSKTEESKVGDWTIHIVDVAGSYKERAGGGPFAGGKVVERTGWAMTGAILVHSEGRKYFVKMIGPKEVIKANREAFVAMIKGIK